MKILIAGMLALTLSACECGKVEEDEWETPSYGSVEVSEEDVPDLDSGWDQWKNQYTCSEYKLGLVKAEVEICNSGEQAYKARYCYALAKKQHCTKND